jgi:hypothetical protein
MTTIMKRHLICTLILAICFSESLYAQKCAEEPTQKKGVWKRESDTGLEGFEVHPATVKYKKQVSTFLDSIANLFIKYNPQPIGSEVMWFKDLRTDWDSITSPDPSFTNYEFVGVYHPYICSNGTVKAYSQTDTWVFLQANGFFHSGFMRQQEINNALREKLFTLPPQRGSLGGYPVFEPIPKGEEDSPWLLYYSVLVHQPGKLPYTPITKGEFFDILKRHADAEEKKDLYNADIKNATPYQIKNNGEEFYAEAMEMRTKQYQGIRSNLTQLEKLYEKEMSQPAILRTWEFSLRDLEIADPTQKKLFTTANRGYQLVRSNPAYMDQSQEKWKPQFIWVAWWKPLAMQNAHELDKVMKEKFDYGELGKLLTR